MPYEDSYEREEKDLNLHLAKMVEHMEFENTLPEAEKHKRRLIRAIQQLPKAAMAAEKTDMPWILFGQLERMCYHAEQILGKDWIEQARRERSEFFGGNDDEDDFWVDGEFDEPEDDQDFDRNYDPNDE